MRQIAQRQSTRGLTEGAILAALTVLVAALGLVAPFVGTLLAPLPIMLLTIRWGLRVAALATVVAALILLMFFGPLNALSAAALFAPLGLGLGWGVWRGVGSARTVLVGAGALIVAIVASFVLTTIMLHQDLLGQFVKGLVESQVQALQALLASTQWTAHNLPPDVLASLRHNAALMNQVHQQQDQARSMIGFTRTYGAGLIYHALPVMLCLGALVWAYLCYTTARVVLRRVGHEPPGFAPMLTWRIPPGLATLLLWAFAGVTFLSAWFPWLSAAWVSVLLLTVFVFGFQGVLVALAWMKRRRLSRSLQIIVVALLVTSGLWPILAAVLLGLLDAWFDFRRLGAASAPKRDEQATAAGIVSTANGAAQGSATQTPTGGPRVAGLPADDPRRHLTRSGRRSKTGRRAMKRPHEGGASS